MFPIKLWNFTKKDLNDNPSFKVGLQNEKDKPFYMSGKITTNRVGRGSKYIFIFYNLMPKSNSGRQTAAREDSVFKRKCPGLPRFPPPICCSWGARAEDDDRSVNHCPDQAILVTSSCRK